MTAVTESKDQLLPSDLRAIYNFINTNLDGNMSPEAVDKAEGGIRLHQESPEDLAHTAYALRQFSNYEQPAAVAELLRHSATMLYTLSGQLGQGAAGPGYFQLTPQQAQLFGAARGLVCQAYRELSGKALTPRPPGFGTDHSRKTPDVAGGADFTHCSIDQSKGGYLC